MASPFRFFHRYQKLFIVLAAVTAVFVFVLADPLSNYLQSSPDNVRTADSAVANWDGGSLNQQQLGSLVARRHFLSQFLQVMISEGVRRTTEEGGIPVDPSVPNFILRENTTPQEVQFEVITTRVLAELAQQSGMTVSDEIINHYLEEFGLHRVGGDDILGLLGRMQSGKTALNERLLFDALREQLLRHQFFSTYASAFQSILPQERWQDWSRLNEQISLQAAILPASQFVSKVPDPEDAQLAAFYEEHKEHEPGGQYRVMGALLPAPDPGFREPRRVRLHYLLGDINTWRDKFLDTITDEEIADYYERNKRSQFVKISFDIEDESETESSSSEEESQEEATDSESEEAAVEAVDETPASESEPKSETEAPASEAEPASDKTGAIAKPNPFQLTAFNEEDSSSETTESEETGTEETTEENSEEHSEVESSDLSSDEPLAEASATVEEEPKEYYPLEEVKNTIRHQLATQKAVQELEPMMRRTYTELRTVFNKYGGLLIDAQNKDEEIPEPPAKLAQLEQLAEQLGLTFEKTGLLSQRELNESPVGRARDAQTGRLPVALTAFSESSMLYEPSLNKDLDGNWYLLVRVEDIPTSVPELKEIRKTVLAAWKQKEAAQLALDQAEILAKEASEAGQSFKDFFADKELEVVQTDLFSWLTFGTTATEMQGGARLGAAPPLEAIGPDFMSAAFALEPEEVKGVLNFDRTQAYVIRIHRREQTEEELHKLFLSEVNDWYRNSFGNHMYRVRTQANQSQLMEQLTTRIGLEFDPDWEKSVNQKR